MYFRIFHRKSNGEFPTSFSTLIKNKSSPESHSIYGYEIFSIFINLFFLIIIFEYFYKYSGMTSLRLENVHYNNMLDSYCATESTHLSTFFF